MRCHGLIEVDLTTIPFSSVSQSRGHGAPSTFARTLPLKYVKYMVRLSKFSVFVFAWPHEMLHVLALKLIGKKPVRVGRSRVQVPKGLTFGETIFVNGLPVLVTRPLCALGFLVPRPIWDDPVFIIVHSFMLAHTAGSAGDIGHIIGAVILFLTSGSWRSD